MAASASQIAQLRRMVAELNDDVYDDEALAAMIETRPVPDRYGEYPYTLSGDDNLSWTATYDLNAAAADVWEEKTSARSCATDISTDGTSMARSQAFDHAKEMAALYRSRASVESMDMRPRSTQQLLRGGVVNNPIWDDER